MKRTILFLFSASVLLSCKKEDKVPVIYTSDVPGQYTTHVSIQYDQTSNETRLHAYFLLTDDATVHGSLKLAPNSYINYNGNPIPGEYNHQDTLIGKEDAVIEFLDYDQTYYANFITAPDTVYFINLPDTAISGQDLLIGFGGAPLASDESWSISVMALDGNDYGNYDGDETTDSTFLIDKMYVKQGVPLAVTLRRVKKLENPNLPSGGGNIVFRYRIEKTVYCQ